MAYIIASRTVASRENHDIDTIAGIVAGWVLRSRSMQRYLKEIFRSNISATRIIQISMI